MKTWEKVRSLTRHDFGFYAVEVDLVQSPGGKLCPYSVIRKKPGSIIIPLEKNGMVHMVRQHRYPVNAITMELPMGSTDGQNPLIAAKREFEEESQMEAEHWTDVGYFDVSHGSTEHRVHVFIASGISLKAGAVLDPLDEDLFERLVLPVEEVKQMIADSRITDALTTAAFGKAMCAGKL